jgi:surfactin synthase thioesterase subunit
LFLPILCADFALSETDVYYDEASLACPISAFGGLQDAEVSRADLTAWHHQTDGTFALRLFHGGHFFLREQQPALLQAVFQDLRETAAYYYNETYFQISMLDMSIKTLRRPEISQLHAWSVEPEI